MGGNGYPQLSPVKPGRFGYLYNTSVLHPPVREVPRQPAWLVIFPRVPGLRSPGLMDSSPSKGSVCCAGGRSACVSDPCFTALRTLVGGVRLLLSGCPAGKDRGNQVSLLPELRSAHPGLVARGLSPGCKKSEIKKECVYIRRTDPNHPAGFRHTVHRLQGCSASGKMRPDTGERPLQAHPAADAAYPTKDWLPPMFTVPPASLFFGFPRRAQTRSR